MTPEAQLARIRSYCQDKAAVTVFQHGTTIISIRAVDAPTIMAAYNIPHNGEGTPAGDFQPLEMDDGNWMFVFAAPSAWSSTPQGQAVVVLAPEEAAALAAEWTPNPKGTEVFASVDGAPITGESLVRLHAGLMLRARRLRDALSPIVVVQWEPPVPLVG